jgi:hypothetical protein
MRVKVRPGRRGAPRLKSKMMTRSSCPRLSFDRVPLQQLSTAVHRLPPCLHHDLSSVRGSKLKIGPRGRPAGRDEISSEGARDRSHSPPRLERTGDRPLPTGQAGRGHREQKIPLALQNQKPGNSPSQGFFSRAGLEKGRPESSGGFMTPAVPESARLQKYG